MTAVFVPEFRAPRAQRLDVPGQALLAVVIGVSVGVLIEGPRIGWTSLPALAAYASAGVAAVGSRGAWSRVPRRRDSHTRPARLFLLLVAHAARPKKDEARPASPQPRRANIYACEVRKWRKA